MPFVWRPVPRFEGLYEVSSGGAVRSLDRACNARSGAKAIRKGRELVPVQKSNGYFAVTLTKPGAREQIGIHILVLSAFRGLRPGSGLLIHTRHLNNDRTDNRLRNLVWGTVKENAEDKRRHRTALFGERHPMAILSEAQAKKIKGARTSAHARKLAVCFGVCAEHAWSIWSGKTWRHLP